MTTHNFTGRRATVKDHKAIYTLYKTVAKTIGGIAREEDEITEAYINNNLQKSLYSGICLVIENPNNPNALIAEIHCYKPEPKAFNHILSELTIVVHPEFQGKGLGKLLFNYLLNEIKESRKDILRVELIARESNQKAIDLYTNLGFKIEGRLEQRINNKNKGFEADIPMAWINPNFKKFLILFLIIISYF